MRTRGRFVAAHVGAAPSLRLGRLTLRTLTGLGHIPGAEALHVRLPPGGGHEEVVHRRTHEWFLVLRGKGAGLIDGRRVRFRRGVTVYMPPGTSHRMKAGRAGLEALAVFSPPLALERPGADIHPVRKARRAP
jgi:mannose-6-phosphate isomerase-like protein (cupin superfamily)